MSQAAPGFCGRQALDNGELRVRYQPQVDLRSGRLSGVEALVRWQSAEGVVGPDAFLGQVERDRLHAPLLQFVMNYAAREMARWLRRSPELQVAINLSASDLEDEDLFEYIEQLLNMWQLAPRALKLEITESSLMRDPERSLRVLNELRMLGVSLSIDDFGNGILSRAWLERFAVDELKIDRALVACSAVDADDRNFVESVIHLAQLLGLGVVAVGVEDETIAAIMRDAGCPIGQGYLFSRPVSGREFERSWLLRCEDVAADT